MKSETAWLPVHELPHALGGPPLCGLLRQTAQDFQVEEVLGFEPDGEGEHAMLQIRKTGLNTEEVTRRIARHAGVRTGDVGYCGLKDRHAVTSQWLSVGLAGRQEPDWTSLNGSGLEVLSVSRQRRKLKRGTGRGNRFTILIREIDGDRDAALQRLEAMDALGVPNYFGEQRFGREYGNLEQAERLFRGEIKRLRPHLRGLYLSAARSQLFNEILALRVRDGSWNQILPGDVMQLAGSRSWFSVAEPDADSLRRVRAFDIHPTGPLWGRGDLPSADRVAALELEHAGRFDTWCRGLESFGLKQERRALRLPVHEFKWSWEDHSLRLSFRLPAGAFATTVIRELTGCPR